MASRMVLLSVGSRISAPKGVIDRGIVVFVPVAAEATRNRRIQRSGAASRRPGGSRP
jgi:hypothetical protein